MSICFESRDEVEISSSRFESRDEVEISTDNRSIFDRVCDVGE